MRHRHGVGDRDQQLEAGAQRRAARPAPLSEGLALDALESKVRSPVGGDAAVEEARDVGVLEAGENLPFAQEAPEDLLGVHAAFEELQRHELVELTVRALGLPDFTHAAASEQGAQAVGSDPVSGGRARSARAARADTGVERLADELRSEPADAPVEELLTGGLVGGEKVHDLFGELRIADGELCERRRALVRRQVGELLEARRAAAKRPGSGRFTTRDSPPTSASWPGEATRRGRGPPGRGRGAAAGGTWNAAYQASTLRTVSARYSPGAWPLVSSGCAAPPAASWSARSGRTRGRSAGRR